MAETTESDSKKPLEAAAEWQEELESAEKELKKFWQRGRKVIKRYMDEDDSSEDERYNVFWANVGVLKASLYANPPKPLVKREFDDYSDDEARVAAMMMQRLLTQGMVKPEDELNVAFRNCVEDRLVPGLGQIWLRYEPIIENTGLGEQITDEYVCTDYVYWEDFWWSPCRTWEECRWVARRVFMTKKEFKKRFPRISTELVSWSRKSSAKYGDKVSPDDYGVNKTEVFEIWDRTAKTVVFLSRACKVLLDRTEDPLNLDGFFPCPKPLLATHTTSSMVPKADYLMVQSQYRRLDNLTRRIRALEDAIQASGVYDKANAELGQLLPSSGNKMIPVDNWAMYAEKGGMKGVVDWFPIEAVVNALDKLRELKAEAKAELYELTGISDIMRGVTKERETAYAQGLKAQYSSVRLQYVQGDVAAFIQHVLRIKADIISKHFQAQTIVKNSLIEMTPDAELAETAAGLIKDAWSFAFRIQVFADTLAIPDYNAERQGRIEFIGAVGQFISQAFPLIEMEPGAAPYMLQILQWGISAFRSAQSIEGVFDKAAVAITEKLAQPQQPKPDPAMVKAQADVQAKQISAQIDVQKAEAEIEAGKKKTQAEIAAIRAKTAANIQATNAKTLAQIMATRAKAKETRKTNGK